MSKTTELLRTRAHEWVPPPPTQSWPDTMPAGKPRDQLSASGIREPHQ